MPPKNIQDLKKRRFGDLTKQNAPRGQETARGQLRVDAFKKRLQGVGAPGLSKILDRQEGRVTEGGRDFAQQKIALIQRRLGNAAPTSTPGAPPMRPGNPPAHSQANPTPGVPRRRRRRKYQNPGRPTY